MGENHCQWGFGISDLADSQVDTVRCRDDNAAVIVEEAEIFEFVGVIAADAST
jgi:hypothetical protein